MLERAGARIERIPHYSGRNCSADVFTLERT